LSAIERVPAFSKVALLARSMDELTVPLPSLTRSIPVRVPDCSERLPPEGMVSDVAPPMVPVEVSWLRMEGSAAVLVPTVKLPETFSEGFTEPFFGQFIPAMVADPVRVIAAVVGAVDMHTKSLAAGALPADAPPFVSDQLVVVAHAPLLAPVQ
jgi:hypothetical protein